LVGDAKSFFAALADLVKPHPTREEVLLASNPTLAGMLKALEGNLSKQQRKDLQDFYRCFMPVSLPQSIPAVRKIYLKGAEPQWGDLYNDLDAPREINDVIVQDVLAEAGAKSSTLLALTGSAGSGKSTVLKRTALRLAENGCLVFFTNSEELPEPSSFCGALESFPVRPVVIFDNISLAMGRIMSYVQQCRALKATYIVAGRTSKLAERLADIKHVVRVIERHMRICPSMTLIALSVCWIETINSESWRTATACAARGI
jgi:hypothetical protein